MKAAILESYRNFKWDEKETPEINENEVLVKIAYAGICGSDMHIFNGDFHPRTPIPFTPGHEMGGTIDKVGSKIQNFSVGDKVAVDPIKWCGSCPACKAGQLPACTSLKLIGVDENGGFCKYVAVPESMLYKADKSIPDEHVALVEVYAIGFHACNRAQVKSGDSIVIWGAGRVGQVILQAARTITTGKIFIVDILDSRLDIANSAYENIFTVNPLKQDPVEFIKEHTGNDGVDISFEAVGHPLDSEKTIHPVRGCIQSIKGGGKVCVLGLSDEVAPIVFKELIWKEAKIIASRVSHGEYSTVLEHLKNGNLKPEYLISKIMPGKDIQEAFELIESDPGSYLKILLDFND
jgi:2-desacetyl-2-hydroxyethyl bacteriochlorophyllide A dehydrogenase